MSAQLKSKLTQVIQDEAKRQEKELEEKIPEFASVLLDIAKRGKLDVLLQVEGTEQPNSCRKELSMLERANLVRGETKYTHRNAYRQYSLTPEGEEIAQRLSQEIESESPRVSLKNKAVCLE